VDRARAPGMVGASLGTVAASNAERVVRYGVRRGFAPERARELAPHGQPRIAAESMMEIWGELGTALGASDLGIELATSSRLEDLGVLGFAVMTAMSAKKGLETFVKYSALLNDTNRWEVAVERRTIEIRLFAERPKTLGARLSHETAIGQMVGAIRQLCGDDADPVRVDFQHAAPKSTRMHRDYLRCRVSFDAPHHRLLFDRSLFDAEPRTANEAMFEYLCARTEAELETLMPRPIASRVEGEVARAIALGEKHDMRAIAARLAMAERSLRRALERGGTSFRAIVDAARRERACSLLSNGRVAVTRAAFDSGFSDASAFSHACRRWFGRSPSELQKRATAHDPVQ
jgi:AraC-like DNA-binding protein